MAEVLTCYAEQVWELPKKGIWGGLGQDDKWMWSFCSLRNKLYNRVFQAASAWV